MSILDINVLGAVTGRWSAKERLTEPTFEETFANGLSSPESAFMHKMDTLEKARKDWAYKCEGFYTHGGSADPDSVFKHNQERRAVASFMQNTLMGAGQVLGYNPRFVVTINPKTEEVDIKTRNGSAARILVRYEQLVIQRELTRE